MTQTGLTPTVVLRYINRMLGAVVQEIELSEEEIMRVVFQESLQTFSKFFPYIYEMTLRQDELIDPRASRWRIPNDERITILGIHNVLPSGNVHNVGGYIPYTLNPFDSQINRDMASMTMTPFTWKFIQPNEFILYPKVIHTMPVSIFVKAVHPQHLKTIGLDMRDSFLHLALLDVLLSLYPIRHRFENMNTPYGQIQPFLEMVDSAKADKEELLNTFRSNLLVGSKTKKFFVG